MNIGEPRNALIRRKPLQQNVSGVFEGEEIIHSINNIIRLQKLTNTQNSGILKIKDNSIFHSLNQSEFEKFLIQTIIDNTDINTSDEDVSELESLDLGELIKDERLHSYIYNIVGNNFPLLGISRIIKGQNLVDITFFNIKDLNDLVGKELVDLFIGKFKQKIKGNFRKTINKEKPGRVIRDNYKHITFSLNDSLDVSEKLFNKQESKLELIEEIFDSIGENKIHDVLKSSGKHELSVSEVKEILTGIFDFGIGSCLVEGNSDDEKLNSFYKCEIASRKPAELDKLGDNIKYDFSKTQKFAKEAIKIEEEIIENYSSESFIYKDVSYNIVINGKINPLLLRYIRKGELISSNISGLDSKIQKYIENLNNGFDFISPKIFANDFRNISEINRQIREGKLDIGILQNNHKSTCTKEYLSIYSKNKKGTRIFIDIIDMGIMNLIDFRKLAGKVNSGEISEENFTELLSSGMSVTEKFLFIVESIKKIYPECKISLGGDEIFIFIPEKDPIDVNDIISNISDKISKSKLKGRITSDSTNRKTGVFNTLDTLSGINKVFETEFTKVINNNKSLQLEGVTSPKVINLEVDNSKKILQNINLINDLLEKELQKINLERLLSKGAEINYHINFESINENGKRKNEVIHITLSRNENFINIKLS